MGFKNTKRNMLYTLLNVIGFGSSGIVKGSLVASAQSVAASAGASTAVASTPPGLVAICVIAGVGILTAVVCLTTYLIQQYNSFGKPADSEFHHLTNAQKTPFLLVYHNWRHGSIIQGFKTREEAEEKMKHHKGLRHMLCLYNHDGSDIENEWGQFNPWTELHFGGMNSLIDNAMRRLLRQFIEKIY